MAQPARRSSSWDLGLSRSNLRAVHQVLRLARGEQAAAKRQDFAAASVAGIAEQPAAAGVRPWIEQADNLPRVDQPSIRRADKAGAQVRRFEVSKVGGEVEHATAVARRLGHSPIGDLARADEAAALNEAEVDHQMVLERRPGQRQSRPRLRSAMRQFKAELVEQRFEPFI